MALDQASVDDRPFGIEVGDADKVTVGDVCARAESAKRTESAAVQTQITNLMWITPG